MVVGKLTSGFRRAGSFPPRRSEVDGPSDPVRRMSLKHCPLVADAVKNKLDRLSVASLARLGNHVVILLLKLGSKKRVNKTQIQPSKTTCHFGAKTIRADSTLKQPHSLYFSIRFLNPDQPTVCTI